MTRDEILGMKPGRELDALVAEKVMGWVDFWKGQHSVMAYPPQEQSLGVGYDERHPVPECSTDISAAWEVVEKLKPKWTFRITSHLKSVEVEYWWEYYANAIRAETAPEAICKAALLAALEESH